MTVEKLCFGQYERAMRADRACRSCKESGQCIPLQEELTMAGEPRGAHGHQYGTSPAPAPVPRAAVRGWPLNSLVPRLRQLAALGVQIAAEAADAIEQQSGAVEPMRDALAWYAEPGNWKRPTRGRSWSNAPASDDRGSRARMVMMESGS